MTLFALIDIAIGIGIIALVACTIGLLWSTVTRHVPRPIADNLLLLSALAALVAALGTLYYSEIVKVVPCKLCWYQRALLYPQVLIFAYGFMKKDIGIFVYTIFLSSLGLLVALYHIALPLFTNPLFCDPTTELCLVQSVKIFGFLTIPMMSATTFLALLVLSVVGRRSHSAGLPVV
jgi:disulfide bond formation protein DsbB